MVLNQAQPYDLPDLSAVDRLLNGCLDLGITHIDTAPAYGLSEERIGLCLAHRRTEFVLSTKVGEFFSGGQSRYDFSRRGISQSVEQSLTRLKTETLDLLLLHAPANDLQVLQESEAVETLLLLKESGLVQHLGFSGKTPEGAREALNWADVLMVEFNPLDRSHASVMAAASEQGVGVIVKKGLASGRLSAGEAIPAILETPGVTNLIVGSLSLEHLRANIEAAEQSARRKAA